MAGPAVASCRWVCDAKPIPPPDDAPKTYPEKLTKIADQISQLTLLETADLTELLKVRYESCRRLIDVTHTTCAVVVRTWLVRFGGHYKWV